MESLGTYLRAQREVRELSLDELIRETRIPRYVGEALEEDRYEDLPAPVFTRGFIRAYLRHLGLSPDEALASYQDRKSTRLNSSHIQKSRMPSSA